MNMFARFDEVPGMTLQYIKETKSYGRTHRQLENSISSKTFCGGGDGSGEYHKFKPLSILVVLAAVHSRQ